jgi:hypothetical protein
MNRINAKAENNKATKTIYNKPSLHILGEVSKLTAGGSLGAGEASYNANNSLSCSSSKNKIADGGCPRV